MTIGPVSPRFGISAGGLVRVCLNEGVVISVPVGPSKEDLCHSKRNDVMMNCAEDE